MIWYPTLLLTSSVNKVSKHPDRRDSLFSTHAETSHWTLGTRAEHIHWDLIYKIKDKNGATLLDLSCGTESLYLNNVVVKIEGSQNRN